MTEQDQQQEQLENQLTDHNYDGIQEFDNPLPGWWKLTFWATLVFSVLYWGWFHIWPGKSIYQSWEADVTAASAVVESVETPNFLIANTEESLLAIMADSSSLKRGQKIFELNCIACHLKDGGGIVGPNMTDEEYLHIKQLTDFVPLIEAGILEKGMTPWKGVLTDDQIVLVAAYLASLRGTTPATPKAAEGEAIPAWPSK